MTHDPRDVEAARRAYNDPYPAAKFYQEYLYEGDLIRAALAQQEIKTDD